MQDNIRFAWFEDQLILLNIAGDTYTVLSAEHSRKLLLHARTVAERTADFGIFCTQLSDFAIESITSNRRIHYTGVSQNCWRLMKQDVSTPHCTTLVLLALRALHLVHQRSAVRRLAGLKQLIERAQVRRELTPKCELGELVRALNAACMLYYRKTKCLEWSGALALVGYRFGYDLRLIVGVQNRPFYAHAWIEHEGHTVGDDPDLRKQLAVILEIN
ncbi:lasso peptide biosynthesis B2 protein [Cupriavidus sp. AcVe19-6a]|uniref:lasso peptide biosynthesis B2 protein n=2 Tax=unclassified Cupriavidus TaxID=2640874 RepID=UPI001AE992CA|nr:lasso peptide biosynthesis B2 protein [Cupriavidus sp. AcVe19-6a]MBP0637801.1 lasso peptide biosynthesis B2 protein [Cupriavidus sp. AcVe19-6a]